MNAQKRLFYRLLNELLPEAVVRESIRGHLFFDDQTVCPSRGRVLFADTKAFAGREAHEAFIRDEIGDVLQRLNEHNSKLSNTEWMIVDRLILSYKYASALPPKFVERMDKIQSAANQAWAKAREKSDSSIFMPHFKKVLRVTREMAEFFGAKPGNLATQYDALLPVYEPGMPADRIDKIVSAVIKWVVPFLRRIQESGVKLDDKPLHGHFSIDRQSSLARAVTRWMGYDYSRGHLAMTTHPFMSTVGQDDHRITMRINFGFLSAGLFAVMHEGGHGVYEQSVDELIHKVNVSGLLHSHGIHEASSRLWENMVGRSQPFLEFAYPTIQTLFEQFHDVPLDRFYGAVNRVEPSYIRVEADELTYMLHIALRYRLERAIMAGDIKPADVPGEWNKLFKEYFGIEVDKDSNGWLQDVHWSYGYIGYFPTYLLGNLAAAQLWAMFRQKHPAWESHFRAGNFSLLFNWLQKNVYRLGHVKSLDSAMIDATVEKLDPRHWFWYMREKLGPLYEL